MHRVRCVLPPPYSASTYQPAHCLTVPLSVCLSVLLSICLSVCLSVCLSLSDSVWLCLTLSDSVGVPFAGLCVLVYVCICPFVMAHQPCHLLVWSVAGLLALPSLLFVVLVMCTIVVVAVSKCCKYFDRSIRLAASFTASHTTVLSFCLLFFAI